VCGAGDDCVASALLLELPPEDPQSLPFHPNARTLGREGVVALWAMSSEGATALCQRLGQDSAYRSRVAEAVSAESVDGFLDDLLDTYRTAREQRRVGVPSRCLWESGALDWLARREQT